MALARIRLASLLLASILLTLLHTSAALEVAPGSSCAALCLDSNLDPFDPASSTTNSADVVCRDSDYGETPAGIKFKQCLECMQKSQKVNGTESDVTWMIYNLRYALGTCLFGFDDESKAINSACVINWACEPLKDAIEEGLEAADDGWGFCEAGGGALKGRNMGSCMGCLRVSENESYLANCRFLIRFLFLRFSISIQYPSPHSFLPKSAD